MSSAPTPVFFPPDPFANDHAGSSGPLAEANSAHVTKLRDGFSVTSNNIRH